MAHPKDISAFNEELALLDEALQSKEGIRIRLPEPKDAFTKKMRLYAARKAANALHYEAHPGSPAPYTSLKISQEDNCVLIRKAEMKVEPL